MDDDFSRFVPIASRDNKRLSLRNETQQTIHDCCERM